MNWRFEQKEEKKLTKDQAEKKILLLKKDLFNIRFKKINNQISELYGKLSKNNLDTMELLISPLILMRFNLICID